MCECFGYLTCSMSIHALIFNNHNGEAANTKVNSSLPSHRSKLPDMQRPAPPAGAGPLPIGSEAEKHHKQHNEEDATATLPRCLRTTRLFARRLGRLGVLGFKLMMTTEAIEGRLRMLVYHESVLVVFDLLW